MSTITLRNMLLASATAIGALTLAPGMATAQAAADTAPAQDKAQPASDGPQLEDIVVTADRTGTEAVQVGSFRGAKQLDTPLTISVIPRAVLDTQQAISLLDALRNTAGVTTSQTSPTVYNNLAIRGIDVENRGNYRLNGTLPIINLTDMPLEDKERVEALKGASALYYGFTTPSGIINLTMKRPTAAPYFAANVFGNSHGAVGGHIDVGGTTGIFGYRLNAVYAQPDSGIDNTRGIRTVIAGAFDIKPTDTITIQLDGEHLFKRVNEPGIYRFILTPAITAGNLYPAIKIPALQDPSTNFGPDWASNRTEETNLLGKVIWKFSPAWEFVASAGMSQLQRARHFNTLDPNNPNTNAANGPLGEYPLSISYQPLAKYNNENYRAEVTGTFSTGPFVHEILIGASQNTRANRSSASTAETCFYSSTGTLLGGGFPTTPVPAGATRQTCRQSITAPHAIPQLGEPLNTLNNPTQITDIGYFVFDRIKLGDWLQVLGGVRKSNYSEKRLDTGVKTFKAKPTSLSGGVVVKPISSVSVYGTYIEGLESTPGAPLTSNNPNVQLGPSQSTQYEGGVKWEPKRGLLFQAAYFNIQRDSAVVNGANFYVKDGRQTFKGVELSLTGNLTQDLSIYASALFLDAKYTSGAPTNLTSTPISPTLVGRRVENTPKTTWSVAGEYRLTPVLPGLAISAAAYYVGNRAINPTNQGFIDGYTLFDLGGSYTTEIDGHKLTFRINGENIGGKRYWASTAGLLLAQGAPSTIKFSIGTVF
ncbi:MAG: TonB-dependent siderophore receptor [Sphingomonas sp.]|jgi:iron complex outermembrane receptor protein|uniref:TonB-dependent siderophore receptor n=1 Tax=Sphingomonas sp. TaxID=28214 RepID=UPI003565C445